MSTNEKAVELIDVINGHALFETEGRYRVVYHGKVDRDIYHSKELLTAEEAIQLAEIYNGPAHTDYPFTQKRKWWAEAVSYKEWEERSQRCQEREHVRDMSAISAKNERAKWKKRNRKLRKKLKAS